MAKRCGPPSQGWLTFLRNHSPNIAAMDLFVVPTIGFDLIRDRDRVYGAAVTHRLRAMGIRDKPIAPCSPWQNGFAERLIGSIRRECVDHVVALGEGHLRRVLQCYARYYNQFRAHRSLNKDTPVHRAETIISRPVLGGLHRQYCRI